MAVKERPPCAFGAKCYRKNPQHFLSYSHPGDSTNKDSDKKRGDISRTRKKPKLEIESEAQARKSPRKKQSAMKQTTLQFGKTEMISTKKKNSNVRNSKQRTGTGQNSQNAFSKFSSSFARNRSSKESSTKTLENFEEDCSKQITHNADDKCSEIFKNTIDKSLSNENSGWVFIKRATNHEELKFDNKLEGESNESIIKQLFLVDMPKCFYSFFDFCKMISSKEPNKVLDDCNLKLVGPYDVLLGTLNLSINKELALCHWRYYYDPPEFQTVLSSNSGYHIGYWRDDPNDLPIFMASNSNKDCLFKIEAENIFGTIFHYLGNLIKTSDPFSKVKLLKFQQSLKEWAEHYKFSLDKLTNKMNLRQKKIVTKSFHKIGIVVPVEKKTELGYRPLLESDANLKRICKNIMEAESKEEKESFWEKLQPLINAANIANDECDFGNSLELGIDLFCMGSPIFHDTIEHLLSTSYTLLNRNQFEKIIRAHLKRRNTGDNLSANL